MTGVGAGVGVATCPAHINEVREAKMRVGLGIGLGMGLPLLAALAGLAVLLRRQTRLNRELRERVGGAFSGGDGKGSGGGGMTGYEKRGVWHEMPGSDSVNEMAGTEGRRELSEVSGVRS